MSALSEISKSVLISASKKKIVFHFDNLSLVLGSVKVTET